LGGTGQESEQTKKLKQESLIQSEILKQLREKSQIIQGEIAGQDLFNRLSGEQSKILNDISNNRKASAEEIKNLNNVQIDDIEGFLDAQIDLQMQDLQNYRNIENEKLQLTLNRFRVIETAQEQYISKLNSTQSESLITSLDQTTQFLSDAELRYRNSAQLEQDLAEAKESSKFAIASNYTDSAIQLTQAFENVGLLSARKSFDLQKGLSAVNATINTYQAVTNALATIPAPFNIPVSVSMGVLGFAQVANILSQKFDPKGGSSSKKSSVGSVNVPNPNIVRPTFSAPSSTLSQQNEDRLKSSNATVILNVQNNLDRQGLALAVREGSDELNARSVTIKSV
jgi:hypothetical protein